MVIYSRKNSLVERILWALYRNCKIIAKESYWKSETEMVTAITEIEQCWNYRPLTYLNDENTDDLSTPNHRSVIKRSTGSTTGTTSGQTDTTSGQTSTTNGQTNGQTSTTSGQTSTTSGQTSTMSG